VHGGHMGNHHAMITSAFPGVCRAFTFPLYVCDMGAVDEVGSALNSVKCVGTPQCAGI